MKTIKNIAIAVVIIAAAVLVYQFSIRYFFENKILNQVIERLQADSRIAEVLVTEVKLDGGTGRRLTTIKFLEYDVSQKPLPPKYFTFSGDLIQFQSLVIRFDDMYVRNKDKLRGRSAYLFWKVFMLDGKNTEEYEITKAYQVPEGYEIGGLAIPFEKKLWRKFWRYALDPERAKEMGVKSAQIEAPGTKFVPGTLYTLKIEHDGGVRIDVATLPAILKGERIPE